MAIDSLLDQLSPRFQHRLRRAIAVIPPGWRQRSVYGRWRRFLADAEHWPAEKIQFWQLDRLRETIRHAVTSTEGYRELYRKAGVNPEDIRSLADLRHLPFTTKEMFQSNLAAFTAAGSRGRYLTTGGSNGIPFGFYELKEMADIERAFMHTAWSWVGWRLGQRNAVLRGAFVGTETNFWNYEPFHRELALSSYFLKPAMLPAYLGVFQHQGLRVLQAYPSSLNLLCDLLHETGREDTLNLALILLGSENVYDWQLEKFKQTFPQAILFSWYGHCEKAVLAPWCEQTTQFHCWPFYGLTEVVNRQGVEVADGTEGEIVGTSLHQRATPFIRYRTMDRAVKGPQSCTACGRAFPLLSRIAGRAQEVIVTKTGRFISMTAINMHDDVFDGLRQFQFQQTTPGELVFQFVPKSGPLPDSESSRIHTRLMAKLGADVHLAMKPVTEIPRTAAGKYRFLDQRLPIRYGDR